MAAPFLALITPLGAPAYPDNTLPTPQPPVDPGYSPPWARPQPPRPTHPIYNPAYPDHTLPVPPGPVDPGYSPPWAQGPGQGPPLGIWGPTDPRPTPPIYFPPPGQPPLGIWGPTDPRPGLGPVAPQPHPEHPIVLPPDLPPTVPPEGERPEMPIDWRVGWTPQTGWIVVGVPTFPHPAPSRRG